MTFPRFGSGRLEVSEIFEELTWQSCRPRKWLCTRMDGQHVEISGLRLRQDVARCLIVVFLEHERGGGLQSFLYKRNLKFYISLILSGEKVASQHI